MRKTSAIAVAALITTMSGTAIAADLGGYKDEPAYVAPSHSSWTGAYLGVGFGAGAMVTDINTSVYEGAAGFDFNGIGSQGVFGTVQGGYDFQLPATRWLLGAWIDYDWTNISTKASGYVDAGQYGVTAQASLNVDDVWAVGGRVGFLTSRDTLVYGLVGYTEMNGNVRASAQATANYENRSISRSIEGGTDLSFDGWVVGAGMETRLAGNWFLKGEYRYSQFNTLDFGNRLVNVGVTPDLHTGRAVLTYKLGGAERLDSFK
jgi:outer membrane immunogenic protein